MGYVSGWGKGKTSGAVTELQRLSRATHSALAESNAVGRQAALNRMRRQNRSDWQPQDYALAIRVARRHFYHLGQRLSEH